MDTINVSFVNFSTPSVDVSAEESVRFLDTAQAISLRRSLYYAVNTFILTVSVITNMLNIVTFIKAGLLEGMSCLFLSLSLSDLLHCALILVERSLGIAEVFYHQHPYFKLMVMAFFLTRNAAIWHVISTLLTVFAAIQKCACVTFPLTFRFFFTRKRSVFVIFLIYLCVIISYIPVYVVDTVGPYFSTRFNRTRLGYRIRNFKVYKGSADYYLFAHYVWLPFVALSINILCVIIMTWKLRIAARTRKDMTAGGKSQARDPSRETAASQTSNSNKIGSESVEIDRNTHKKVIDGSDDVKLSNNEKNAALSERELRVLRSVNLVCGIFIGGTAPYCILNSCALFLDSFDHRGRDFTLYYILVSFQEIWYFGSTSLNIFVYYIYNSKFKKALRGIFSPCLSIVKLSESD
ncbi:chemosensory receptor c [Plakobranchus ocellatus]|uniref:Chemosensory receptor c n=1 Tax=Plakobranchus ocellatus TaxID=259542 RepID=A0AAV3YVD6_9GAST|nr:chemosensory receptor c [Plakobranchus ocellatus]